MGVNERFQPNQSSSGVLAISGAAPQTAAGNTVTMSRVEVGTLSANIAWNITANTITFTAKWQVSDGGASPTWVDCAGAANAPANVAFATGDGSLDTGTICIPASPAVYGKRFARLVVVSGTAAGGGAAADDVTISYNYRLPSPFVS